MEIPKHWPCAGIHAFRRIMFEHRFNLPGKPWGLAVLPKIATESGIYIYIY
jgi:hypothetical protein